MKQRMFHSQVCNKKKRVIKYNKKDFIIKISQAFYFAGWKEHSIDNAIESPWFDVTNGTTRVSDPL